MDRCFYLTSVGAKGNARFWKLSEKNNDYRTEHSHLFWEANRAAYLCYDAKKRNRVYKREMRKLIDLWWTVYYLTGFKINGLHLGQIYLKLYPQQEC